RWPTEATLRVANSAWVNPTTFLRPEFAASVRDMFAGEIAAVDLRSPAALARINLWASDHTRGMVPHILDRLPPDSELVLVNVFYFRGAWATPFPVSSTSARPFHLLDQRTREVPMMAASARFAYAETPLYQVVELGYRGSDLRLRVILPRTAQ